MMFVAIQFMERSEKSWRSQFMMRRHQFIHKKEQSKNRRNFSFYSCSFCRYKGLGLAHLRLTSQIHHPFRSVLFFIDKKKEQGTCPCSSIYILVRYVGEKCHLSCSLDSYVELSLVKSASAGYTSGEDLSSLRDELSELSYVLVVNAVNLILTEDANLLSSVHGAEVGTGRIVSFHFDSQTFLTHDFYIAHTTVSRVAYGRSASLFY